MKLLAGKVAVVTGGATGLGRAHAELLVKYGASVVVNDLGEDESGVSRADLAAAEIGLGATGEVIGHTTDIGSLDAGESLVDAALEAFGRLDVVVNNAGIIRDRMIFNMDAVTWDEVIRIHGTGTFAVCRAAAKYFRSESKANRPVQASIINTTSEAGLYGNVGQANYSFAKAGIVGMTYTLHHELYRMGVRCNAISPCARTSMTEATFAMSSSDNGGIDLWSTEHVSPVVAYLASDASIPVSGQVFIVWGGEVSLVGAPELVETYKVSGRAVEVEELIDVCGGWFQHRPPVPDIPNFVGMLGAVAGHQNG